MKPARILVLSVSAGAGHVRAAEALRAQARESFPGVEVTHLDLMELVSSAFKALYAEFYIKLVEHHPSVWAYLYRQTDRMPRDAWYARVRRAIERLNTRKLHDAIAQARPDQIVCTHFLPAELLAHEIRRGRPVPPVWVQVTDFDVHRLWVQAGMRGYFAASAEVAFRLERYGIAQERIAVTGIPIMPAFARPLDRAQCAGELGIDAKRTTLLMMSGGVGLSSAAAMVEHVLGVPGDFAVVALAGRNRDLLRVYQALAAAHPGRLTPLGFTGTIERVMACADLAVTKPGGLTVSECMAMHLPMIVVSPIPGQEEHNADYLLEQGVALKALDAVGLEFRLRALLSDRSRLGRMRARMERLGRPDAARAVLERVLPQLD